MVNRSRPNLSEQALTKTQATLLEFIQDHYASTGVSPSYREIQSHFHYKAIGTVQDHIRGLVQKGFLEQGKWRRARNLLPMGYRLERSSRLPIYGEIAAGLARQAEQIKLGEIVVSKELSDKDSFALRVVGDSMVDIGIYEGDILIVEKEGAIRSGQIIVALLAGETTVKRYIKKGNRIFLVPENKKLKPIEITTEEFKIQGKVVGLQRKF